MGNSDSMTLAFDLAVIDRLENPVAVFDDARRWSTYVGVVSDRTGYEVVNHLRERGIYNEDFFSMADRETSLDHIADRTNTERHVYIGADDGDEALADRVGWEFLTIREASEKAEWNLTDFERNVTS